MRHHNRVSYSDDLRFKAAMALFAVGEAVVDAGEWLYEHGVVRWWFTDRCFGLCLRMMGWGERLLKPKR